MVGSVPGRAVDAWQMKFNTGRGHRKLLEQIKFQVIKGMGIKKERKTAEKIAA